jgi:hypothetical protein
VDQGTENMNQVADDAETIRKKVAKHRWVEPPVHPVNDLPMMSDDELDALAKDIKANGLQEPVILWRDNREEANGSTGPFPIYLLDGRNRLAALKRLGIKDPTKAKYGDVVAVTVRTLNAVRQLTTIGGRSGMSARWETDCDPLALHTALNVYRRHLTTKQKRKAIENMLIAQPGMSDRVIAKKAKASPTFVGTIRSGVHGGQVKTRTGADGKKYKQAKKSTTPKAEPKPLTKKDRLEKAFAVLAKLNLTVDDLAEHSGHRLVAIEKD